MNKGNWWIRIRHYKLQSPQFFTDRRELDFFAGCGINAWIETELLVLLLRSTKKYGQFTHSLTSDWQLFVVVNELLCINYLYIKVQWQQLQLEHFCGDSQVASRNSFFCPRLVLLEEQRTKMKEEKKKKKNALYLWLLKLHWLGRWLWTHSVIALYQLSISLWNKPSA